MKFRYKTEAGRVLVPSVSINYECKKCGYGNNLVLLNPYGPDATYAKIEEGEPYESLCHKCDDVEMIFLEFLEGK